ncbi:Na+/proline symporter [Bernardetia litoralis DSM 6794]|uniref:Na+/proline symporter n=1 Tax=Bernardetia litoralis (strain ATCC 23117 / DSM 6794 / NBRC 15988 / NCIMB 1366 / Fx l1 / Sio-4) TaxID=880071 RepID=I4AMR5_BERLS|nr:sodium:solute symporter [Bernardetia litoralis]AFM05250.1 Na+/proline symporter [Bernardetia litoralis DSM 6794]
MNPLDWAVLIATQVLIIAYGVWKTRKQSKNLQGYLLSDRDMNWFTIGLSIMATQASAITFLSTPGQAFGNGMGFIQFYFGLPIAMVILSITAVPIYHKLNVYTAYEYLENRFDLKTRSLGAALFLTQRGLAAGLSIYAPAIILSTVLGWNIYYLIVIIGIVVIAYTVFGGTKAVSQTQKQQMLVILIGMVAAGFILVSLLPKEVSVTDALSVAGAVGRLEVINLDFDVNNRYNVWSGIIGGLFLALSYFGTDQSQVQRYLTGKSIAQTRVGLLMNGMVKIPMQFLILLVGIFLFAFYQFYQPPIFFNTNKKTTFIQENPNKADSLKKIETLYSQNFEEKKNVIFEFLEAKKEAESKNIELDTMYASRIREFNFKNDELRNQATGIINNIEKGNDAEAKKLSNNDLDYAFINFVLDYLPIGLIGLLVSVMLSAAMSSASSELNALGSTTVIDIYKRSLVKDKEDEHYVKASKGFTMFWGIYAIFFAMLATQLDNLIQAVNILGSLFYGTILGIFLVAFYIKKVKSNAVFYAAIVSESLILCHYIFLKETFEIGFLWYNLIGCVMVIVLGILFQTFLKKKDIK